MSLPHKAAARLTSLNGQAIDARDAAVSAQRRIEELRQTLRYSETEPPNADELKTEIARLEKQRAKMNERAGAFSSLVASINLFLQRRPNLNLELDFRSQAPKLEDGETVLVAVGRIRDRVFALRSHVAVIRSAPMPTGDIKKAAHEQIERMAERGRPNIRTEHGQFKMSFNNPADYTMSPQRVMELLAYLMKDQLIKLVDRDIDKLPKDANSMPGLQKAKRILELEVELDRAERHEELLIQQAEGDGIDILRRHDASPLAVLGVTIKKPERARVEEVA